MPSDRPKRVLHNVLGGHIILNLRAAARRDTGSTEGLTYNMSSPQTELMFRPEWLLYSDVAAVDIDTSDGAAGQSEIHGSEVSDCRHILNNSADRRRMCSFFRYRMV